MSYDVWGDPPDSYCRQCDDALIEMRSYERWCDTLSERLENYHGCVAFLLAVVAILALLR